MPNPYILLGLLIGAIGLFGSGISIGVRWERNDSLAHLATAQNAAINAANAVATTQIERAVAAAKTEGQARAKASAVRFQGELDAALKSRPQCSRDLESMGLLNRAIDTSNGVESPTSQLPDGVRPSLKAADWIGARYSPLGIFDSGTTRPVP